MANRKHLTITSVAVTVGLVTVAVGGYCLRDEVIQAYYIRKLDSESEAEREFAAKELGAMKSVKAIPHLLRIPGELSKEAMVVGTPAAESRRSRIQREPKYVFDAISQIGLDAVPTLVRLLDEEEDVMLQFDAAIALGKLRPKTPDAIGALERAASHGNVMAVFALGEIGEPARGTEGVLLMLLEDRKKPWTRAIAAWALGEIGVVTPATLSALERASGDEDQKVGEEATSALRKLNPN